MRVLGVEENEEPDEPRDRHYWETRASHDTIALMDGLLGLVREVEPGANLTRRHPGCKQRPAQRA